MYIIIMYLRGIKKVIPYRLWLLKLLYRETQETGGTLRICFEWDYELFF